MTTLKEAMDEMSRDGSMVQFATTQQQDHRGLLLKAMRNRGTALRHVQGRLRNDRLVVYCALRNDASAMHHAPEHVRQDRWLALEMAHRDGLSLQHLAPMWQDDFGIVQTAVSQNAWAFRFASTSLRANKDLIVIAVEGHARNLLYVSDQSLRSDRELILRCVERNSWALHWAGDSLLLDRDFLLQAVELNPWCMPFAHATHLEAPYRNSRALVNAAAKQGACPSLKGRSSAWRAQHASRVIPFGRGGHDVLLPAEAAVDSSVIEQYDLPPRGLVCDRGVRAQVSPARVNDRHHDWQRDKDGDDGFENRLLA